MAFPVLRFLAALIVSVVSGFLVIVGAYSAVSFLEEVFSRLERGVDSR